MSFDYLKRVAIESRSYLHLMTTRSGHQGTDFANFQISYPLPLVGMLYELTSIFSEAGKNLKCASR
ncbi:MAG TPA: hypothetical protein DCZ03_09380 [Gammaproteobacteria bacterium]|nr:hypothetical protein [Gammaproteobacteria bacterium]